jgi:hypothetical protein
MGSDLRQQSEHSDETLVSTSDVERELGRKVGQQCTMVALGGMLLGRAAGSSHWWIYEEAPTS